MRALVLRSSSFGSLQVGKDKQQKLGMAENPFAAKIEQATVP